ACAPARWAFCSSAAIIRGGGKPMSEMTTPPDSGMPAGDAKTDGVMESPALSALEKAPPRSSGGSVLAAVLGFPIGAGGALLYLNYKPGAPGGWTPLVDPFGVRQKYEDMKAQIEKQAREPLTIPAKGPWGDAKILDADDIQEGLRKAREAQ